MGIIENRSYFDTLGDDVNQMLNDIIPLNFKGKCRSLKKQLKAYVLRRRGVELDFLHHRLALDGINDSVLIKIGPKKRGHLAAFRGYWVRVIWFGRSGFTMNCLVYKIKITKKMEKTLIPRGPYTKEEFTDEVSKFYYLRHAVVDGEQLVRSTKGQWVSSVPTDRALINLEKDEIPDGSTYQKPVKEEYSTLLVGYHKLKGYWIKDFVSRQEVDDGELDWVPVGVILTVVDWSQDSRYTSLLRTKDGWEVPPTKNS
jgi:hypothetical protein